MAIRINIGENFIVQRPLRDKNGNPILVSDCTVSVEIKQFGKVLQTLTYPSTNCRAYSGDSHTLEIEVPQSVAAGFKKGDVFMKTTITAPDTDFVTDSTQKRVEEKLWAIVD